MISYSAWDQSEKFVKLYLTGLNGLDKCPQENIKIEYTKSVSLLLLQTQVNQFVISESVTLRVGPFGEQASKVFTFGIKKTCHMINPDKSYHKVTIQTRRSKTYPKYTYYGYENTRQNLTTWPCSLLSTTPEVIGVT